MIDAALIDKTAFWVNFAYFSALSVTVLLSVAVVYFSNQRAAAKAAELERIQTEADQRVAVANASASKAQSEAASAIMEQSELRKRAQQLSIELEREKRLRMDAEDLVAQQEQELQQQQQQQPQPTLTIASAESLGPRVLTAEQESLLVETLSRFTDNTVTVVELADAEAGALARQIASLFLKANWGVFASRLGGLSPTQYGVICTHAPGDSAAAALVSTLRSIGLVVYERTEKVDQFQIIVGLKPTA